MKPDINSVNNIDFWLSLIFNTYADLLIQRL